MPKRLLREAFESFLGSHVDPEKDEELKGTKAEMEDKVQCMLKVLKEEDDDGKEQLQNLIADFHKHYQSLYERYDHLTEELRKKAYCEHEKDSSSSRSDSSVLDDSPRKKGRRDGKVESNVKIDAAGIKQELDKALFEVADCRRHLVVVVDEKESLNQEYQSALSKLQGAQNIIAQLNAEADIWNVVKSKLLAENVDLNTEVERTRKLHAELNQKLEDVNRDWESLSIAKEASEFKVEEEKRNSEELRTINGQLQHEKHAMQVELRVVKGEFSALKQQLISVGNKLNQIKTVVTGQFSTLKGKLISVQNELNQTRKVAEEEKSGLSLKISQLEDVIKHAENKIQDLVTESSQLRENLAEKERELSSHLEIYGAAMKKLESAEKEIAKLNRMREDVENSTTALVSMASELHSDMKESTNQVQLLLGEISRFSKFIAEETRRISIHQDAREAYKKN